jgi:hypothetical protein
LIGWIAQLANPSSLLRIPRRKQATSDNFVRNVESMMERDTRERMRLTSTTVFFRSYVAAIPSVTLVVTGHLFSLCSAPITYRNVQKFADATLTYAIRDMIRAHYIVWWMAGQSALSPPFNVLLRACQPFVLDVTMQAVVSRCGRRLGVEQTMRFVGSGTAQERCTIPSTRQHDVFCYPTSANQGIGT